MKRVVIFVRFYGDNGKKFAGHGSPGLLLH
jgi:hypothetical protein